MINIEEKKLKAALQIGLGSKGVYTDILENELIHHIKELAIPDVGSSLPKKKKSIWDTKTEIIERQLRR